MFKRVSFLFAAMLLAMGVSMVYADTSTTSTVQMPVWLQAILGAAGVGGSAALVTMRAKIGKTLMLIQDLKNAITETIGLFSAIKNEIKDPVLLKEFNEACEAIGQMLIDTGNPSCIQKGQMFKGFERPMPVAQAPASPVAPIVLQPSAPQA